MLGSEGGETDGYDLRGAFVGSEGMCGIATRICVRLTQTRPAVRTMLFDFSTVDAGAQTVSSIIAAGMVPAALEMMDQLCVQAVEQYIHAGLPVDAAAVLLVEVAGAPHGLEHDVERIVAIAQQHGCGTVRIAQDEAERALLWKGRKTAFGAIARIKPNYYLHDTVVPRRHLPDVLRQVYEIADRPRDPGHERVPRRRRQPAPAAGVRQARAGDDGTRARRRRRDRPRVGRRPAGC